MSDNTQSISSIQPNLRFGTSFLDTKYRDRAADGESLMDKRTGEVVLKRKEDGSFLYFNREAPKIDDFIMQVASLIKSNVEFTYPSSNNRTDISNIQFMTTLTDLQDFGKSPINGAGWYDGTSYVNNSDDNEDEKMSMTMAKEMNGFFLKVMSRPRDSAIIEFLGSIYNKIKPDDKIDGEVEVIYTATAYNSNKTNIGSITRKVYIPVNQTVLVPFFDSFKTSDKSFITLRINSLRLPKIKDALDHAMGMYGNILESVKDMSDESISLTHMYISSFVELNTDTVFADSVNSRLISSISLSSFENAMNQVSNISSAGGIHVSPDIPDDLTLSRIEVWAERFREVHNKGETVLVSDNPVTNLEELEYLFGEVEGLKTYLTSNQNDAAGIYVKPMSDNVNYTLPW